VGKEIWTYRETERVIPTYPQKTAWGYTSNILLSTDTAKI